MTKRLLIANRGEIAVRVIRSAAEQGYRTIAVYSEADADALHVSLADEAVLIGPAPVADSYLAADRILDAARRTGAQAIHPGYGFLSENAAFARACVDAGLVFIGPSAEAIDLMGNKAEAKRRMLAAGVPCIPGYQDPDQSDEALLSAGQGMGVPIMVKAAAGGGGRGMRLVTDADDLPQALAAARSEAENAFGSGELILEKAVVEPRHVEVQVFGDSHGTIIHLGERDCSVQRRHQKVVEEAPCPVMTPALREAMGKAAVDAARSIDYCGAGTVEFLLDASQNFYFLEMNTRLQVEHPVTELVTGLDLVALQLQVAQGYPIGLEQEDIALTGHAIEVRLYAEDTANDFLPATGRAHVWQPPTGEGVRVDHGLASGQDISPFYDPMVAKIIAWGEDRATANRRLIRALEKTVLFGVDNNRRFLIDTLRRSVFAAGEATTAFIDQQFDSSNLASPPLDSTQAAVAAVLFHRQQGARPCDGQATGNSWGWRTGRPVSSHYEIAQVEQSLPASVLERAQDQYVVTVGEATHTVNHVGQQTDNCALMVIDGVRQPVWFAATDRGEISLQTGSASVRVINRLVFTAADQQAAGSGTVLAPMHGNLLELAVAVGDEVAQGQLLAVMEAMKMEHRLQAEVAGTVTAVHAVVGQQVAAGALILEIDHG